MGMNASKKAIKEFEHLLNEAKGAYQDFVDLTVDFGEEILALLNEQEEEIENLKQTCQNMMEGVCLLKEQEAKTGHLNQKAVK